MSAIASSYKITEARFLEVRKVLDRNGLEEVWELLATCRIGTLPYSGYVLAAVIPFAQARGIKLPITESVSDEERKQLGIVGCGTARDYHVVAKGLSALDVTDAELGQYFAKLYAQEWDEAATAMRRGFQFIQEGIESLSSDSELLIFSIH